MRDQLYSLVYFSRSVLPADPARRAAELERIVRSARHNNLMVGVTGALLFGDQCFAQVLEGAREDVELVFERVRRDPRHADLQVLSANTVHARSFGDWSMAFAGVDAASSNPDVGGEGILDPQDILATQAGRRLLAWLRDLVQARDGHRLPADAAPGA